MLTVASAHSPRPASIVLLSEPRYASPRLLHTARPPAPIAGVPSNALSTHSSSPSHHLALRHAIVHQIPIDSPETRHRPLRIYRGAKKRRTPCASLTLPPLSLFHWRYVIPRSACLSHSAPPRTLYATSSHRHSAARLLTTSPSHVATFHASSRRSTSLQNLAPCVGLLLPPHRAHDCSFCPGRRIYSPAAWSRV